MSFPNIQVFSAQEQIFKLFKNHFVQEENFYIVSSSFFFTWNLDSFLIYTNCIPSLLTNLQQTPTTIKENVYDLKKTHKQVISV